MSHISITVRQRKERKAPGDRGRGGLSGKNEMWPVGRFRITRVGTAMKE